MGSFIMLIYNEIGAGVGDFHFVIDGGIGGG
jgi:hypothetical protein